jgi:hypothetical protein
MFRRRECRSNARKSPAGAGAGRWPAKVRFPSFRRFCAAPPRERCAERSRHRGDPHRVAGSFSGQRRGWPEEPNAAAEDEKRVEIRARTVPRRLRYISIRAVTSAFPRRRRRSNTSARNRRSRFRGTRSSSLPTRVTGLRPQQPARQSRRFGVRFPFPAPKSSSIAASGTRGAPPPAPGPSAGPCSAAAVPGPALSSSPSLRDASFGHHLSIARFVHRSPSGSPWVLRNLMTDSCFCRTPALNRVRLRPRRKSAAGQHSALF